MKQEGDSGIESLTNSATLPKLPHSRLSSAPRSSGSQAQVLPKSGAWDGSSVGSSVVRSSSVPEQTLTQQQQPDLEESMKGVVRGVSSMGSISEHVPFDGDAVVWQSASAALVGRGGSHAALLRGCSMESIPETGSGARPELSFGGANYSRNDSEGVGGTAQSVSSKASSSMSASGSVGASGRPTLNTGPPSMARLPDTSGRARSSLTGQVNDWRHSSDGTLPSFGYCLQEGGQGGQQLSGANVHDSGAHSGLDQSLSGTNLQGMESQGSPTHHQQPPQQGLLKQLLQTHAGGQQQGSSESSGAQANAQQAAGETCVADWGDANDLSESVGVMGQFEFVPSVTHASPSWQQQRQPGQFANISVFEQVSLAELSCQAPQCGLGCVRSDWLWIRFGDSINSNWLLTLSHIAPPHVSSHVSHHGVLLNMCLCVCRWMRSKRVKGTMRMKGKRARKMKMMIMQRL